MKIFAIFHLNLMFSSIPEESRTEVIKRCYWPLLKLAESGFPLGIEASGITLEIIRDLDPEWITNFKALLREHKTEFVGSGYGQIIGPLVPPSVNRANLALGMQTGQEILDTTPQIALVNEQAWSAGMVEHYREAGYKAVFMDYDNPARYADWPEHIQHFPQRAKGTDAESIPVIWSRSMVFQKLQRFAHRELELSEYLDYMENLGTGDGWLPVYGNDAEIFDFRPGRYKYEAAQNTESEWQLIRQAFEVLSKRGHEFRLPSEVLRDLDHNSGGNKLDLTCARQPIPVKKQSKYNITRWALSGRDDFRLNSLCRAACHKLEQRFTFSRNKDKWRKLCFCWSSDLRTHITKKKYAAALAKLEQLAAETKAVVREPSFEISGIPANPHGRMLKIETGAASVTLNTAKGLAIQKASFPSHNGIPSLGTLDHGYFDEIDLGADFFSGHIIMEGPGIPKDTDLARITPFIEETDEYITVSGSIGLYQGMLDKVLRIHKGKEQIDILYRFALDSRPPGYARIGHVTLLTADMDPTRLFYSTCNGGRKEEFQLNGLTFDHSDNISFAVSASQGLGMTDSRVVLGGAERALEICPLYPEHGFITMVKCRQAAPSPFVRVFFSMQEMDETSLRGCNSDPKFNFSTGFSIKPLPGE
ncbi:glycoside hydrolase [Desulfovibrio sp. JC010]|uniref:glycoside hydrolase n=1 Tax=Desulfovibrio sp. JC010 TaxID=2593641 RepID=UPI0013D21202|nr:glycoside hydrolase [Desulfovibrio sp. JC010]NDV26673.1 glycoside hydrolase [Desulfovibrio sp. JC010]